MHAFSHVGNESCMGLQHLVKESQAFDEKCGFLHSLAEAAGSGRGAGRSMTTF